MHHTHSATDNTANLIILIIFRNLWPILLVLYICFIAFNTAPWSCLTCCYIITSSSWMAATAELLEIFLPQYSSKFQLELLPCCLCGFVDD